MEIVYILILGFIVGATCQDTGFESLEIVSDLTPENCFDNATDYITTNEYGLPQCTDTWGNGVCNKYFNEDYKNCDGKKANITYKPTSCTKEGTFGAVQCKGERTTGRCFCFDEDANRLFGQAWWAQAENMTCACSRRKALMSVSSSENYIFFNTMHCNSMGNYEGLQCDIVSEQCWCADEKTGDLTSAVVPLTAISMLPCFTSLELGTQYLRQCENKLFAQKNIEHQLSLRGTTASFGTFLCDGDGAFGVFAISDALSFCTWRDNSKLGTYSSGTPDPATQNCNCARDKKIYEDAGKTNILTCTSEGNYQAYQGSGNNRYCIDPDGFRKSEFGVEVKEEEQAATICAGYTSYVEEHCSASS